MDLSNAQWRKASQSTDNGGNCVEISSLADIIAVRDSKDPTGPTLAFSTGAWRSFTEGLKRL